MTRNVCVIGMGLIGGSIALSIKKEHDAYITGVDIDQNQLKLGLTLGVIDRMTEDLSEGVGDADLIVLAAPVTKTEQLIDQLKDLPLKEGTIVTDVGSTKTRILKKAAQLSQKGISFIGGHPMAGSHKSGVQAARSHLFENAFYVLTPDKSVEANKIIQLQNWLKGTKARFIELSPGQHDKLAGLISHLPHVVAASLVQQVRHVEKEDELVSRLAAGGFRDITRIASSNPVMWRDILLHNKDTILELIKHFKEEVTRMETMLEEDDEEKILQYFSDAKAFRDGLPSREKGALPAFYDLFVDIPDHPGVISDVTGILGQAGISITNIRIIETRADIMGVLRLTFRSHEDREEGRRHLENSLYETYIMD